MIWVETRAGGEVKGMGLASLGQEQSGSMGWGKAIPGPWKVRPWLLSGRVMIESESQYGCAPGHFAALESSQQGRAAFSSHLHNCPLLSMTGTKTSNHWDSQIPKAL